MFFAVCWCGFSLRWDICQNAAKTFWFALAY